MVSKIWYRCLKIALLKTPTKRFFRLIPVLPRQSAWPTTSLPPAYAARRRSPLSSASQWQDILDCIPYAGSSTLYILQY